MGHWEPISTQVWDTVITPCDCCGQVVPRRLWVAEVEGEELQFCSERCEDLYRTHVLPQRRTAART